jgi:hypothetical protein
VTGFLSRRRLWWISRSLAPLGALVVLAAVCLLGVSAVSAARAPSLSFVPNMEISGPQAVIITASHFDKRTMGGLSECNITPGEPTILDETTGQQEPVGCQAFSPIKTTEKGALPKKRLGYGIATGVLGPPASGIDSAGTDAATDAQNYPCPPVATQIASGAECQMVFTTIKGQSADEVINFYFESTTTTAVPPIFDCDPIPTTDSGGSPTVVATPGTCLQSGDLIHVTGSGLAPNSTASLTECNADTDQPTVVWLGTAVPVSCSPIVILTTTSGGTLSTSATFTVLTGTVGPPATGTDSSGGSATADAADYPCPPTPAQEADGVDCVLHFGDLAGDQAEVPLSFGDSPCRDVTDGVLTAGSRTVTSATAAFASTDVGSSISAVFIPPGTTMASVVNVTTATMSAAATTSATGVTLTVCS